MARVLVIDPDREVLEIVEVLLNEEGFDVVMTTTLGDASGLLQQERFDLILTEVFEQEDYLTFDPRFLESLQTAAPGIPIMIFSVFPSIDQVRAERYGLAGVVAKPFDIDNLLTTIEKALKNRSDAIVQT